MKKISILLSVLILVLILIFFIILLKKFWFSTKEDDCIKISGIRALFSPPKDYGIILFRKEFDLSKKDNSINFFFTNKYSGIYILKITMSNFDQDMRFEKPKMDFELAINFYTNRKLIKSFIYNSKSKYSPFYMGNNEGGISLISYECPNDLPCGKNIDCEVILNRANNKFYMNHYPIYISLEKITDK